MKEAKAVVKEAVDFALNGSEPLPKELYTFVHSNQVEENLFIRGCDVLTSNQSAA